MYDGRKARPWGGVNGPWVRRTDGHARSCVPQLCDSGQVSSPFRAPHWRCYTMDKTRLLHLLSKDIECLAQDTAHDRDPIKCGSWVPQGGCESNIPAAGRETGVFWNRAILGVYREGRQEGKGQAGENKLGKEA